MSDTKHTPTPWIAWRADSGTVSIQRQNGPMQKWSCIATMHKGSQFPNINLAQENAEFACLAANNHDALVAALEKTLGIITGLYQGAQVDECEYEDARALLAKIESESAANTASE